jgi:hypothetical protein
MKNLNNKWMSVGLCVALTACALISQGCEEEPPPVVQAPPPPPPPPPPAPPAVTPIEQLMIDLNIDPRVSLPEEKAPDNDPDRKAVLVFFDAFARGNEQAVKDMLSLADQLELEALVKSGSWQTTVKNIQSINVQAGAYDVNKCALAVIEVGKGSRMTFQPQLWYYTTEEDAAKFEAVPTPPGIMDRLSGDDWIEAWHQLLDDEQRIALIDDEVEELVKRNVEGAGDTSSGSGPSGGGGKGGLRDPGSGAPVEAPGTTPIGPSGR